MRSRAVLLAILLLSACGSSTTAPSGNDLKPDCDAAVVDTSKPDNVVFPEIPANEVPDEAMFDVPSDTLLDIEKEAPGPACSPGEGCFLDKCTENAQCQSGWCVDEMGEGVCSQLCEDECPSGWNCQQVAGTYPDLVFVCVSKFANLCKPCDGNEDCKSVGGADDVCIAYGNDGDFCGGTCQESKDCPWGFSCKEVQTTDGADVKECVADTGTCPCTTKSVTLAATTSCQVANDFGTCTGKRTCTVDGLSPCDAATPGEETCNGADDDCDGETDEPPLVEGEYGNICDDGNDCTDDSCKATDGCEHLPMDGDECKDGDPCTVADHCVQGVCVGTPVECKDDNPCTDDGCDMTGGCVFTNNTAACDDGNACTVADQCKEGICSGIELPCDCQMDADCAPLEDGDLCNGTLYCNTAELPYQCEVAPETVVVCSPVPEGPNAACQKPECVPSTGECKVLPDKEGFLCDDGDKCTVGDKCSEGKCLAGTAVNCNDGNVCTDDTCVPETGCVNSPNTSPCADGDVCTKGDQCEDGVCTPGQPADCDDSNPCTDDSCDPAVSCTNVPNEGACDDGNACTTGDHCAQGKCVASGVPNCSDGNICTDDTCDPEGGCIHKLNSAPCDDGDDCTIGDACSTGLCKGKPAVCNDNNSCTDDSCDPVMGCLFTVNAAACDDGNLCTTGDHCANAVCVGQGVPDCDDGEVCTKDYCVPAEGCKHDPLDIACSDGSACTLGDHCSGGKCVPGQAVLCDDSNPCTADSCDVVQGCLHSPAAGFCDDGNPCTMNDACKDGKCVGGPLFDCDDANPCTKDACDPTGKCIHSSISGACGDGNACTVGDTCQGGKCVGLGVNCDDGNACTDDKCDNPAVGCYHVLNNSPCDDGNKCTFGDTCKQGVCSGMAVTCDDGNACTTDNCDPVTGCMFTNNIAPCDDNNKCTVSDSCSGGKCVGGPAPTCNDGNPCTSEGCDPAKGCLSINNTLPCDDGSKCTENDKCSGGSCAGVTVLCDDGNPCTDDSCDPAKGCIHANNGKPCNDATACTSGDTCAGGKCVGTPVTCNDSNDCTTDTCNAVAGCQYTPLKDGIACGGKPGWACKAGACKQTALSCGETTCPDLSGYGVSCNAQDHCEYASMDSSGWKKWDVWIYIPPGSFLMGCPPDPANPAKCSEDADDATDKELPQHVVTFNYGFLIGKYEVVVEQYAACVADAMKCSKPIVNAVNICGGAENSSLGLTDHPQNGLTWDQAKDFCMWVAPGGRLPSEAEWEYAASGPVHRKYPWGNGGSPPCTFAIVPGPPCNPTCTCGCGSGHTWPVGSRPEGISWCGALDMGGNIEEWCEDMAVESSYVGAPIDGSAWILPGCDTCSKVTRGGSFASGSAVKRLRSASRSFMVSSLNMEWMGTRCVRPVP